MELAHVDRFVWLIDAICQSHHGTRRHPRVFSEAWVRRGLDSMPRVFESPPNSRLLAFLLRFESPPNSKLLAFLLRVESPPNSKLLAFLLSVV